MHVSMMHASMMHVSMIHVSMMHVSMMHVSMILDPDTCMYDAYIYNDTLDYAACVYDAAEILSPTDERTNEQGDSRSRIHDPDTCVYDAHIYDPRSLTLMHVCMMHISMILDP